MPRAGVRTVEFKFGDVLKVYHGARVLYLSGHPTYKQMFLCFVLRPGTLWSALSIEVGYLATQNYSDSWEVDEEWPTE